MTPFSPFPFAIVGFDLDGTLLDTSGDLAAAVNHALVEGGRRPLSVGRIKPMVGGGARQMLASALAATGGADEATIDRLLPVLLTFYEANIAIHTRPFPHSVEAVDALRMRGVRCAVVTNKRESFALKLLRSLDLLYRFDVVLGDDTLGPDRQKPKPDLIQAMVERCGGGRAAFVGDSIYDVQAAQAAHLPVVACSFGFLQQPVNTLGADAVIDRFDELVAALERLGAR